eukprot:814790_1
MSDLIVDFYNRRRSVSEGKKAVQFSKMSSMKFVEKIDERDANLVWYSQQDYRSFRLEHKQAVIAVHQLSLSSQAPNQFSVDELTGIENLLAPKMIKKTRASRAQCMNAVLGEQERQVRSGFYDQDRLAMVSQESSNGASRRAKTIGFVQSQNIRPAGP